MRVLHICSYFLGTNLYTKFFEAQEKIKLNAVWYVPVSSKKYCVSEDSIIISTCYNKYDRINFFLKEKKCYDDLINKITLNKCDIIHAHSLFSNGYLAWKIFKKNRIPYIVAVRNTDLNVFFKYMLHLRKIGVKILLDAKKIIFLSEAYREALTEKYIPQKYREIVNDKAIIIPNGIDEFWLENIFRNKRKVNKLSINLITAGTIEKNKNQVFVAEVCQLLKERGMKIRYTVAGKVKSTEILNKLEKFDFFSYAGELSKEKLLEEYRKNDIFVLLSVNETFGLVYAEAMSQGLPIIYTKGQGFDKQFTEGIVGYHAECFNKENAVKAIMKTIENYECISNSCIKNVQKFDWDKIVKVYESIYNTIISQ